MTRERLVGHIAHPETLRPICATTDPEPVVEPLALWERLYPNLQCPDCREWRHA